MCGIVGHVGPQPPQDVVIGGVVTAKKAGKLANLENLLAQASLLPSWTGVGHIRWATHGPAAAQPRHVRHGRVGLRWL